MVIAKTYRELIAYQKAFSLALDVHKTSLGFPDIESYALADQMRRASKSICANIAEGYAKQTQSKAEFHRFLNIAIGSANEMSVWVDFCENLSYINNTQAHEWKDGYDHIAKMLNKFKQSSK
jgi:four helix bundle protein